MSESTVALRAVAVRYHEAGWHPIELPAGAKAPPPDGRTGYGGSDMTLAEIEAADWSGNIGLRMPDDVIGLDVDVYHGGDATLAELLARCGLLPPTWISHSGRNDGSGIRFYRVPPGMAWVAGLAGIEIIQRNHRYSVVYPSTHPDGRGYDWADQIEALEVRSREIPAVENLPELPWTWIAELSRIRETSLAVRPEAVDIAGRTAFVDEHHRADQPGYIGTILAHFAEQWEAGYSRHDSMQHCLIWAMECVRAGIASGRPTVALLADRWVEAVSPDARRAQIESDHRTTEFEAMLRHAIGKVQAKPEAEMQHLHDVVAGPTMRPGPAPEIDVDQPDASPIFLDWATFADRDEAARSWLVESFWPWGRSMALWAAAKTGKSELALWCAVKLALGEHPWTGDPVEPVDVAYFDYEMTEDDLDDRLAAFGINPTRLGRLHYALLPPLHALDDTKGGGEVEQLVVEVGAKAVVFDTFSRAVGGDENEADTVRAFYRFTGSRLKRLGIGYLRIDHAGKDPTKGQRGSSAKRDDVDIVWRMTRANGSTSGLGLSCEGSSRLSWVGPHLAIDRSEVSGVLSYSSAVRLGWPAGTAEKVKQLDALGLPVGVSRRAARTALEAAGLTPGRNQLLSAAIKFRLERGSGSAGTSISPSTSSKRGGQDGDQNPPQAHDQHE